MVSRETVRRVLNRLDFRWRRPRPVPPPKDPKEKRKRLEDVLQLLQRECSFFQNETKLETNPKVGFCWMPKGKQRKLPTPGTNRKVWISGVLEFSTGRFRWVVGERKNDELFLKLLGETTLTPSPSRRLSVGSWTLVSTTVASTLSFLPRVTFSDLASSTTRSFKDAIVSGPIVLAQRMRVVSSGAASR